MADNGGKGILSGGTELLVEGRYENHCLGDAVSFHGERLIITGKESCLDGGLWIHDYALRKEGECHVDRICNPWLAGAAVEGTVLGTTLTCSRLALETDGAGEEAESEHTQPVYYAGGGKGYSGQPEKGDTQYLYFPTMREEDRYIIGGADAGKERIDALVEANEQERREEEKEERCRTGSGTGTQGSIAAAGAAMAGIRLADGGRGRVTVLETGITVWSRRNLELETGKLYGAGADVTMEAGDYIWLHSGDSGLLLSPDGLQAVSGRLALESPENGARELPGEGMVQAILGNYWKIKTTLPPFTASDGSIIHRDGFDEVMRNEELFNFFSENVLGTDQYEGRYKNDIGQSPYLLFDGWLDELYGRSEAAKFWDHLSTLDGLQDVLDVVGFVWEGADLVNAVISLCRGHFKEAGLYCISAFLPVAGDLIVKGAKGVKGLSSLGMDLASGAARSSDEVIDTLCLTYRATDNAADLGRYVDDVVGMIPADGRARLLDGMDLLDGKSRIVYEAYDGSGNLVAQTRNLDEHADLPGGRGLADGAMDQWGNGRTPRDMVMQGNAPGNMADDLHMYGMADGTGGRPLYDLYANNRPGGATAGGAKTGDTINDATQQAARRADDAADAGRAAGGSGSAGAPKGLDGGGIPKDNGNRIKEIEVEFNNKSHLDESEFEPVKILGCYRPL